MLINQNHGEFSLSYDSRPIQAEDSVFVFQGNTVLLHADSTQPRIPLFKEIADAFPGILCRFAFSQGTKRYYIAAASGDMPAPAGLTWEMIRVFRTLQPEMDAALLNAAWHLSVWYAKNRCCGVCGGATKPHAEERALQCQSCGNIIYPAVHPAVIVAVIDQNKLLLARNANGTFRHFSLIAGFVEIGETAEQAVRREVLEEVGLHLKNIRYIASQPWGLSQSLILGFTAELDGSPAITLQESELSEARWFARGDVPMHSSTTSIAFDLMDQFRRGLL